MKIKYNNKILEATRYGKEEFLLNDGTIINESECEVVSETDYTELRDKVLSTLYCKLILSNVLLTQSNIESIAENAISYTNALINKLKQCES